MDRITVSASLLTLLLTFSLFFAEEAESTTFTIVNKCHQKIWPGFLSGANSPTLSTTGFSLRPGQSRTLRIPAHWSGRFWARTHCHVDNTGRFSCITADCGSGTVECGGAGAKPPATLAEFTLNGDNGLDFYDVSLVDGFNLPMLIIPRGGTRGGCGATGCLVDINGACPASMKVVATGSGGRVRRSVACRSACEAFGEPRFCCTESYSTPETCPPTEFSVIFKHACPRAYSYAYDDGTSTYTCASADYVILFCPLPYTSLKFLEMRKDGAKLPLVNKTMMYFHSRQ